MKRDTKVVSIMLLVCAVLLTGPSTYAVDAKSDLTAPDRTVPPIQEPMRPLYKELDARNAKMPLNFEVKAPTGAPNVVIILIDDLGFGASAAYGGPIPTPTLQRLAQDPLTSRAWKIGRMCAVSRIPGRS